MKVIKNPVRLCRIYSVPDRIFHAIMLLFQSLMHLTDPPFFLLAPVYALFTKF